MGASSQRALEDEQADERLRDAAPLLLDFIKNVAGTDDGFLRQADSNTLRSTIHDLRYEARDILDIIATGKQP